MKEVRLIQHAVERIEKDDLRKVLIYVNSLIEVDKVALQIKEDQAIEILGFNPSDTIPDHEWDAQLKRLAMSDEKEKLNDTKA